MQKKDSRIKFSRIARVNVGGHSKVTDSRILISRIHAAIVKFAKYEALENNALYGIDKHFDEVLIFE